MHCVPQVALSTTGFFDSLELLLDHLLNAVGNVFSFYGTTDAEVERLEACVSMLRYRTCPWLCIHTRASADPSLLHAN